MLLHFNCNYIRRVIVFDLIKTLASENIFDILAFVRENPGKNASKIARELGIHVLTVQRALEVLERYSFVSSTELKAIGRPSRVFQYRGGSFTINLDLILDEYSLRSTKIRDAGREDVSFMYDVDHEVINGILIGGRGGKFLKIEEKTGRFLWLVPPPDSQGETIEDIAKKAGCPVLEAVRISVELKGMGILEYVS
jgi:predicted transcriptional regulator